MYPTENLLITNAKVLTLDADNPRAEALVTQGNRILFVGTAKAAEAVRDASTRVIDAGGCTLIPGISDCHYHILLGSLQLGSASLGGVTSLEQLSTSLRCFAAEHPEDYWVTGTRIGYNIMPGHQRLNRQHLDAILPEKPVILISNDFHTGWANTRALELAGVLHGAELGSTGEVVMGEDGLASGELREIAAYGLALDKTEVFGGLWARVGPQPDVSRRPGLSARAQALILEGVQQAARLGITSIHNMDGDAAQVARYAALEASGELPIRIYFPYTVRPESPEEALEKAIAMRARFQGDLVRCGSVKMFMDGVVESWTALMLEDYANRPGNRGEAIWDFEAFTQRVLEFDRQGFQIITHALGDGAVRRTLDAYEEARRANGVRDSRHRVEHIELLHRDDLPRFKALGVIASMQPLHHPDVEIWPTRVWPDCIRPDRWSDGFAWQDIRATGARLVFGSDWPVASQDPWWSQHVTVNGQHWAPGLPDQRQSLQEALASYTRDAAYAEFMEGRKGQLRPGMLADMVLLREDLEAISVSGYKELRPRLTVCDGRITFEA